MQSKLENRYSIKLISSEHILGNTDFLDCLQQKNVSTVTQIVNIAITNYLPYWATYSTVVVFLSSFFLHACFILNHFWFHIVFQNKIKQSIEE